MREAIEATLRELLTESGSDATGFEFWRWMGHIVFPHIVPPAHATRDMAAFLLRPGHTFGTILRRAPPFRTIKSDCFIYLNFPFPSEESQASLYPCGCAMAHIRLRGPVRNIEAAFAKALAALKDPTRVLFPMAAPLNGMQMQLVEGVSLAEGMAFASLHEGISDPSAQGTATALEKIGETLRTQLGYEPGLEQIIKALMGE